MKNERRRVGFVSTRFAGTDGVSLETVKWANTLGDMGYESVFFAGESDWPHERSYVVAEAHFNHPEIMAVNADLFGDYVRTAETSRLVQKLKEHLKTHLSQFLQKFQPDILIAENALAIPMNIPLGLAITEVVAETGIPLIAHHHDFAWERDRFSVNVASDYLRAAFPPSLPSIYHVVINSFAAHQLAMRTGERSILLPNVMDFESPPPPPDDYAATFRAELGIPLDEFLLLQPTRIVPRKKIEDAIELVRRIELPSTLVISHAAGDEGKAYEEYLRSYAELLGVRVIFAADRIGDVRGVTSEGRKIFSLADAYSQADLVTYPSVLEGFGNAFLEAVYYRRPIIMRNYEIFTVDIQPKGFKVITFGDFITQAVVEETRHLLQNPALGIEMSEQNYEIARRYYSYRVLEHQLTALMDQSLGTSSL